MVLDAYPPPYCEIHAINQINADNRFIQSSMKRLVWMRLQVVSNELSVQSIGMWVLTFRGSMGE